MITGQCAAALVGFAQEYHTKTFIGTQKNALPTARALFATAILADTVLALTLSFLLRRRKSKFDKTNSLLNRIMIYAIGTGLITSVFGLVALITSIVTPMDPIYFAIGEVMPKRK